MQSFLPKLRRFWAKLRSFLPEKLPTSPGAFENFFYSSMDLYSLPTSDSYKQAFATMIMHLKATENHKSKRFFAKCIHKSMANQIAYDVIDSIRQKEKEIKREVTLSSNERASSIDISPKA